jgi:uncharacterized membrane protein YjfL (UPF0719 family)
MRAGALAAARVHPFVYAAVRFTLLDATRRIPAGQVAAGIVLGTIAAGILNAACMRS